MQYTSKLFGRTPPICIAGPSWLLSLQKEKPNSTPPICTAVRLPFVRQYASHWYGSTFEKVLGVALIFFSLPFWISLLFSFQGNPCFFERFLLLFQGFWGFAREKESLLFLWVFPFFSKTTRKRRSEWGHSETGRIRFRGVRFQTPSSVSFFGLTEFG